MESPRARLYRTDDDRRSSGGFGLNDLPHRVMLAHQAHPAVDDRTLDSREECTLRGVALGAAFAVAKVSTPFCYRFRYLVLATALHEIRWYHYGSLASSRT